MLITKQILTAESRCNIQCEILYDTLFEHSYMMYLQNIFQETFSFSLTFLVKCTIRSEFALSDYINSKLVFFFFNKLYHKLEIRPQTFYDTFKLMISIMLQLY